jgi:hypothetical protein
VTIERLRASLADRYRIERELGAGGTIDVMDLDASADGRRLLFLGRAGTRWLAMVSGLSGEGMRALAALPADEPLPGAQWGQGDTIYVSRWRDTDNSPSLWRLSANGGDFLRIAALPVPCRLGWGSVSPRARRAVCEVNDFRYDIWVYRVPGVSQ